MITPFAIVLVRPARPANVGAAARAMKNFGLKDLRIVGSRDALPGGEGYDEAKTLAWKAADVLERAQVFEDLPAAVADLHLVAAATARVDAGGEIASPRSLARELAELPMGLSAGCVFGPEVHGLSNVELDLCRLRVRIPSFGEQPSLNLAQAVVVLSYEIAMALADASAPAPLASAGAEPASEGELQRLTDAACALGLRAGYFNPQAPEHVLGELRGLLARARPTTREVSLLLGMVKQLDWANRNRPDDGAPEVV